MKNLHFSRLLVVLGAVSTLNLTCPADEQRQRASTSVNSPAEADKLDLNTADASALEAEPAIGPDLARVIIAARPYATIDDLDRVKGISAERLEQIRLLVKVSPASVPAKAVPPASPGRAASANSRGTTANVDLNTADLDILAAVPGIGPETARAIIAARPFATVDDLSRVEGITAERLEQIRANVTVRPRRQR